MPTEIQRGELVDRLRRFMGLTGKLNLSLDENVVPVATVADVFDIPYRLAVAGAGGTAEVAANAGFPSQIAVTLPLSSGTREQQPGAFVVREVVIENAGAGAAIFQIRLAFNTTPTWTAVQQLRNLDRVHDTNGTAVLTAIAMRSNNAIAFVGSQIALTTLGAGTVYRHTFPIVLGPGSELVVHGPSNFICRAQIYGDYFPTVQL